jgi:hypothetical protein
LRPAWSDQDPCCSLTNSITSRETDSEQHGSWSDFADAQAGMDPCWSQTHYIGFCHDMAHFMSPWISLETYLSAKRFKITLPVCSLNYCYIYYYNDTYKKWKCLDNYTFIISCILFVGCILFFVISLIISGNLY